MILALPWRAQHVDANSPSVTRVVAAQGVLILRTPEDARRMASLKEALRSLPDCGAAELIHPESVAAYKSLANFKNEWDGEIELDLSRATVHLLNFSDLHISETLRLEAMKWRDAKNARIYPRASTDEENRRARVLRLQDPNVLEVAATYGESATTRLLLRFNAADECCRWWNALQSCSASAKIARRFS